MAHEVAKERPVLWYRFRAGVNDSLAALLFELGEYLRSVGSPAVAEFLESVLPDPDPVMATRLLIRELAPMELLLVLDDLHIAEHDRAPPKSPPGTNAARSARRRRQVIPPKQRAATQAT